MHRRFRRRKELRRRHRAHLRAGGSGPTRPLAPAIWFGDESNVEELYTTPLADADGYRIGPDRLNDVDVPVRVLQGGEDEVMPPEESRRIVDSLPNGELVEMEDEDHSFTGEAVERVTVEETLDFLPK